MMIAVGERLNVTGIRSETAAAGPNPGSTPTSIPRTQPMNAKRRFSGVRTVTKPLSRLRSPWTPRRRERCQSGVRQVGPQPAFEDQLREQCDGHRDGNGDPRLPLSDQQQDRGQQTRHGQDVAQDVEQDRGHGDRASQGCHAQPAQGGWVGVLVGLVDLRVFQQLIEPVLHLEDREVSDTVPGPAAAKVPSAGLVRTNWVSHASAASPSTTPETRGRKPAPTPVE